MPPVEDTCGIFTQLEIFNPSGDRAIVNICQGKLSDDNDR